MMSTTFTHTHTQCVKDRVNNVKSNRGGAERGTTLNELQEAREPEDSRCEESHGK